MLKKLFAHEWKDSWKLVTLFNVIVVVFTIIGIFALSNGNWIQAVEKNSWYASIYVSYFLLYYFAILALGFATTLYFLMRFYKNLYTDQGYLMHTLPVTSHQLIVSKAFVMYIWQVISGCVMIVSILLLVNSLVLGAGEENIFKLVASLDFSDLNVTFLDVLCGLAILLILIGAQIFSIMFGYLAISLGQLSKNHKIIASIGIYVGMQTALQMLLNMIQLGFNLAVVNVDLYDVSESLVFAILLLVAIIIFAADAGMYMGSNHIMKNKLNLE
ncbi:MAG: hypothetical protein NC412_06100 [Roseburia sp.]|nr:hypothetical protein [Roseburia sp.]MCM1277380.1 hypothetical protein [Robinsoniella sp.]